MTMTETALKMTPETRAVEDNTLRGKVRSAMQSRGLSQKQIGQKTGYNASAISTWLAGKYAGNNTEIETAIRQWLERDLATVGRLLSERTLEWIRTPTANSIIGNLGIAHRAGMMMIAYGGAGMGKTITCKQYTEENRQAWMVEMSQTSAGMIGALNRIAQALRMNPVRMRVDQLEDTIVERLSGTGGILIIDEAQALSWRALEAIRSIYDRTGVGMALLGNHIVYSNITGGGRKDAAFAQYFSRLRIRIALEQPLRGDVTAVAKALDVRGEAELDYLYKQGLRPGAMREVVATILHAREIAAGEGKLAPSLSHFKATVALRGWEE